MNLPTVIYAEQLNDKLRIKHTTDLFGLHFPLRLEPCIFTIATQLSADYCGGYWVFNALSNGGFYMAPVSDTPFRTATANGFEGTMSADAFGIAVCLYAYSVLAFRADAFAGMCADHFHWLRAYAMEHQEWAAIARAID